jgi:hypothetical protein
MSAFHRGDDGASAVMAPAPCPIVSSLSLRVRDAAKGSTLKQRLDAYREVVHGVQHRVAGAAEADGRDDRPVAVELEQAHVQGVVVRSTDAHIFLCRERGVVMFDEPHRPFAQLLELGVRGDVRITGQHSLALRASIGFGAGHRETLAVCRRPAIVARCSLGGIDRVVKGR